MLDPVHRHHHIIVPILILAQQSGVAQAQKQGVKQRAQRCRGERIKHPTHLIITRDRARHWVDRPPITLFRERRHFEVEQRGTFEREQGESTFQDIRPDILRGIAEALVGNATKAALKIVISSSNVSFG